MRVSWIAICLIGCGNVTEHHNVDAPAASDAPKQLDAALAAAGITGSGFNICGGSETGNLDAPIANNCASLLSNTQIPTFVFATPIHAAGFSTDDIDYGNDNPVVITVSGSDANDTVVVSFQRTLAPCNSLGEENAGALFIGWQTAMAVTTV